MVQFTRRRMIGAGLASLSGLSLSGCDRLHQAPRFRDLLSGAEQLNYRVHRALLDSNGLAPEFTPADLSPVFRSNGTALPDTEEWRAHAATGFRNWRLRVFGLVTRPLSLSLDQLRRLPARTQITRHDCVEGWSAIGQWTGARLGPILQAAGLHPSARFLVFHCADRIGGRLYYESLDLIDAFHPQTILAYALNGATLPVPNGAPLRLRVERQLGYKHAKYLTGIQAVDRLDLIGGGKGGFWEDVGNYEWYAGI